MDVTEELEKVSISSPRALNALYLRTNEELTNLRTRY